MTRTGSEMDPISRLQRRIGSAVLAAGLLTIAGGTAYNIYETNTPHSNPPITASRDEIKRDSEIVSSAPKGSPDWNRANEALGNELRAQADLKQQGKDADTLAKKKAQTIWTASDVVGGFVSLYGVSLLRASRRPDQRR